MEADGLAKPVLIGPHTENFAEAVEVLIQCGGAQLVCSAADLVEHVTALLREPQRCEKMGAAAQAGVISKQGATRRTVEQILDRLA